MHYTYVETHAFEKVIYLPMKYLFHDKDRANKLLI